MYTPRAGVSTSFSSMSTVKILRTCWELTLSIFDISSGVILGLCSIVFNISMAANCSHDLLFVIFLYLFVVISEIFIYLRVISMLCKYVVGG